MNNKILVAIIILIIIFIASGFLMNKKKLNQEENANNREQAIQEIDSKPKITLDIKHQYKDGKHIYVGSTKAPSPCHELEEKVTKENNDIILEINVKDPQPNAVCVQVITDKYFYFEFEADEKANVLAKLNGELVNLNIFEIPADKNIEDIEIYIKG